MVNQAVRCVDVILSGDISSTVSKGWPGHELFANTIVFCFSYLGDWTLDVDVTLLMLQYRILLFLSNSKSSLIKGQLGVCLIDPGHVLV